MSNLKDETIAVINYHNTIENIDYSYIYTSEEILYKDNGLDLEQLDFDYDGGYGLQEVFGFIVFKDGTWLERAEYDGSEWWRYQKVPCLPNV